MEQTKDIKLVILESPFAGDIVGNVRYARECARHAALMGEATQASHLYYTQFLDDHDQDERALGIALGLAWRRVADYNVFYTDRGWSQGMLAALSLLLTEGRAFKIRALHSSPRLPLGYENEHRVLDAIETVEMILQR